MKKVSFSLEDAQELAGSDNKKKQCALAGHLHEQLPGEYRTGVHRVLLGDRGKRFDSLYKQIDLAPEEFKKLVNEEVENNAATDKSAIHSYFTGRARHHSGNKTGSKRFLRVG
ncbi:hypothetical protein ACP0HM_17470 [Escherichia coli]